MNIPPKILDEYHLVRFLGQGAMGQVFLYQDPGLERYVAVKFVARPDDMDRKRFQREARAIARLQHPNVITIHRAGEYKGWPYIVQEFVKGEHLSPRNMPMSWHRARRLGLALASGLAAAHRADVVHRDIKPSNIMMTGDGQPKLVDFGLAKIAVGTFSNLSRAPRESRAARESGNVESENGASEPLTRDGEIIGTSYYLAPELWDGAEASTRSDVYALGVVLYQMCTGRVPFDDVPEWELRQALMARDVPSLMSLAPDVFPPFARLIERCLRREPDERYPSAEQLRDALGALDDKGLWATIPDGCPYRGLLPFEATQSGLFFGRNAEIRGVVAILGTQRVVFVSGESGVGKSSLVRAGVLPRIVSCGLGDDRVWSPCVMTPGKNPVHTLVSEVARRTGVEDARLTSPQGNIEGALSQFLQERHGRNAGTVFFVDQMEELVTVSGREQAYRFCDTMAHILESVASTRLVATVRGDHLTKVALLPGLGGLLGQRTYFLNPLGESGVREAIVEPARVAGVEFESPAMADTLVAATLTASSGLPLLQFSLLQLWERRDVGRGVIPVHALDDIGGVEGTLARRAEEVWNTLLPDTRDAARAILLRLVTGYRTRTHDTEDALVEDEDARREALEALCLGRLIVPREMNGETVFELVHEALIDGWPRLCGWLNTEGVILRLAMERLASAAHDWERLGRPIDNLWRGKQLQEAHLIDVDKHLLSEKERDFLRASRIHALRVRRAKRGAIALLIALAISAYASFEYLKYRAEKRERERIASEIAVLVEQANDYRADAESEYRLIEGVRKNAIKHFESGREDEGDTAWNVALSSVQGAQALLGDASRKLDQALQLDRSRDDVRHALVAVLVKRVQLADEAGQENSRDTLLERLGQIDREGRAMARWTGPRRVSLNTSPPGLPVSLCKYKTLPEGTWRCESIDAQQRTPAVWQLSPGSYRLVIQPSPENRQTIEVRYPFLVTHAHEPGARILPEVLNIPRTNDIPGGFAYIPPGAFLYGFGRQRGDEIMRQWYKAMPIHTRTMNQPYLIARNEATYAQWIAYLNQLDPEVRKAQLVDANDDDGRVGVWLEELDPDSGMYRLRMRIAGVESVADMGEPIIYPTRTQRVAQDWLALPVTGLSGQQIEGYMHWLDHTRQVRGARLCDEDEWERAARGADGRMYTHGDRLPRGDANIDDTHGRKPGAYGPDKVGSYPASASPFQVFDMVGNARELTVSIIDEHLVVRRSGSFYVGRPTNVLPNRDIIAKTQRDGQTGFRVCADWSPD